jgi:sugar phosphate isomerase/epimerase
VRLGAFFDHPAQDPDAWALQVRASRYRAAYAPFRPLPGAPMPPDDAVAAYRAAAARADVVIAEVGAWGRNPLSEDEAERCRAVEETAALLDLADRLDARCVVNGAGWRKDPADNFSEDTFALVADTTRRILDLAKPVRTFFTLEIVPNGFPHDVDSYLALLAAVDRPHFGVHLDPVNLIGNDRDYYRNADLLRRCFREFGPRIRSCHAKDVLRLPGFLPHYEETRPGLGRLDYATFVRLIDRLDPDLPLMLEHLAGDAEYDLAAAHVRACADA